MTDNDFHNDYHAAYGAMTLDDARDTTITIRDHTGETTSRAGDVPWDVLATIESDDYHTPRQAAAIDTIIDHHHRRIGLPR